MSRRVPHVVLKFGGTSVAKASGWATIAGRVRALREAGERPWVVCSALSGVSNLLEEVLELAIAGSDPTPLLDRLKAQHHALAADLDVPLPEAVSDTLAEVDELLHGVHLVGEASPRVRARVMSAGELMSTRLGAAWMRAQGLPTRWLDARDVLTSTTRQDAGHFVSASVEVAPLGPESELLGGDDVVLTQGFIARDEHGETTLLGRGGSDTSAAYFGVLVGAARVEIWTDVRGVYSANPKQVSDAHLIDRVDYDEASTMAGLGAKVLHPRCLPPLRRAGIPLHICCTYDPEASGTVVESVHEEGLRCVTSRSGLTRLELFRPARWQPVGFVADVAACFKDHGLSIDLMSTSPSTLAVTLDPTAAPLAALDHLLTDLSEVCEVREQDHVASVSVVGTGVRAAFDRLGPAVHHLEDFDLRMVVQGAANHHLTFVLPEEQADDLVTRLHHAVFREPTPLVPTPPLHEVVA